MSRLWSDQVPIKMQKFRQKRGPGSWPEAHLATGSTQKCCLFGVMIVTKSLDHFWKKWILAQKSDFLHFTYITHLFGLSRTRLNAIITIVLYLTVLHGIALLASAPGLYLARHLSTLYKLTHLRQTLSSWKLCYRLFFARRPKHEIDLIFRQVNFQLGKLLENFEKKMSAKHFGCNKPWGEYRRLQDSPRSSYEFNLKALRP